MVNNHGDRKSPKDWVVGPRNQMAYMLMAGHISDAEALRSGVERPKKRPLQEPPVEIVSFVATPRCHHT